MSHKPTQQEAHDARMRALDRAAIDRMRYSQRRTRHAPDTNEDGYRQALMETRSRRLGVP